MKDTLIRNRLAVLYNLSILIAQTVHEHENCEAILELLSNEISKYQMKLTFNEAQMKLRPAC